MSTNIKHNCITIVPHNNTITLRHITSNRTGTVSYTHLDVYKRQLLKYTYDKSNLASLKINYTLRYMAQICKNYKPITLCLR